MSTVYGTNESLIVDDRPDSDGELSLSMAVMASDADSESVSTWINKAGAEELIAHLQAAFHIDQDVEADGRNRIYVITQSVKQRDGTFQKTIDGCWRDMSLARNELNERRTSLNSGKMGRARVPVGQVDCLTFEILIKGHYHCQQFYEIVTLPINI